MKSHVLTSKRSPIMVIFFTTLLLFIPFKVNAEFSDDFSSIDDGWIFYQRGGDWAEESQHTWIIENGALKSGGVFINTTSTNLACHQTGIDEGKWAFDIYGPTSGKYRFGFRVSVFPKVLNQTTGFVQWDPSHVQMVIEQGLDHSGQNATYSDVGMSQLLNEAPLWLGWYDIGPLAIVDSSEITGWHHYTFEKNSTHMWFTLDGNQLSKGSLVVSATTTYDSICLWSEIGSGVAIDNIILEKPSHSDDRLRAIILPTVGIVTLGGISYSGYSYFKRGGVEKSSKLKKMNLEVIRNANVDFDISDSSIFSLAFGATKGQSYYSEDKFKELLPQEILAYRYLLHPIRMTTLKILYSENRMRSVHIKNILDASWGEFGNHIRSLEKNEYIEIQSEFNEDGNVMQVVYITEFGRKQFEQLFTLLQQFVAKSSPYEYLMYAKANLKDDELYPKDTGFE